MNARLEQSSVPGCNVLNLLDSIRITFPQTSSAYSLFKELIGLLRFPQIACANYGKLDSYKTSRIEKPQSRKLSSNVQLKSLKTIKSREAFCFPIRESRTFLPVLNRRLLTSFEVPIETIKALHSSECQAVCSMSTVQTEASCFGELRLKFQISWPESCEFSRPILPN